MVVIHCEIKLNSHKENKEMPFDVAMLAIKKSLIDFVITTATTNVVKNLPKHKKEYKKKSISFLRRKSK